MNCPNCQHVIPPAEILSAAGKIAASRRKPRNMVRKVTSSQARLAAQVGWIARRKRKKSG